MSRINVVLILSLLACGVLRGHRVCDEDYCVPPTGDLASGRVFSVNSSCVPGETFQEVGPGSSEGGVVNCDSDPSYLNDGRSDTSWVSLPGQERVVIQLDLETEFRLSSVNIIFVSLIPSAAVLEASSDSGGSWRSLQFYSTDCEEDFGMQDQLDSERGEISDVVCTSQYTGVDQLGGSLRFQLVLDEHLPFYATEPLHLTYPPTYLTLTNLRLRLTKFQPTLSVLHYYSVASFEVEGTCHCFGHADSCVPSPGYEGALVPGVCECMHNTGGDHCQMCEQGFNKRRWSVAYPGVPGFCQKCECNVHSSSCYYDILRETQVCSSCQHNTVGDRCEKCVTGYFQNPVYLGRGWLFHPEICEDCQCHQDGSLVAQCDQFGFCSCRANVMGAQCSRCKPGFYGLSADNPDGCRPCNCGTGAYGCDPETGACLCKRYATGIMCQTCRSGYYGPFEGDMYGCRYCRCAIGATIQPRLCHPENGTCLCKEGVEGEKCSRVVEGYYVEMITQSDVDSRLMPLVRRGNRVAEDLAGFWFDENTQVKRCEVDLSGSTCCSYSQKLISLYLNNGGLPCSCHFNGTQSDTQCNGCGGQCVCRDFTVGRSCGQCSSIEDVCATCPRASPAIGDCLNCFCNGFSQDCSVASGWEQQLIASDFDSQEWIGEFERNVQVKNGYNPILSVNEMHLFYYLNVSMTATFSFPPEYLGNKRNAYSNRVSFALRVNFKPTYISFMLESVEESSLLVRDLTSLTNVSGPGVYEFSLALTESGFVRLDFTNFEYLSATETEARRALAGVSMMQIVVAADTATADQFVELFSAELLDSVQNGDETQLASNVESCICPIGYTGQFCERCSPGYTRSPDNGGQFARCVPCSCNNHSTTCHPEESTCFNCQDNTVGKYCHLCREGFYGNASSPQGCLPCLCPSGPSSPFQVSNSCVAIDPSQPETGHMCTCPDTYEGQFCEGCVVGYRGEPREGVACATCDVCYDQYRSLVEVIPDELDALQMFAVSCRNWTDGFDNVDRLQVNISTLQQLILKQKLSNSSNVCELKDSLLAIQTSLKGVAESVRYMRMLAPNVINTVQLTEQFVILADSLSRTNLPIFNSIENVLNLTRDSIYQSNALFLSLYPDLVNASNSFYLNANRAQITLYDADIAISRSIQLYLTLNTTEIPTQLDTLERFRNVVYRVSVAGNMSLCGGAEECNLGTYQRIVNVADIFQSYLTNLTEFRNEVLGPYNYLLSNKSSFESLLNRFQDIYEMLVPLNQSVCTLVPVVEEWIQNVDECLQLRVNASQLEVISTEILQLTITLTVSETLDIIVFINRTLKQVLTNKRYLTERVERLELTQLFIANLTNYQNKLSTAYSELMDLNSNITSNRQMVSENLTVLEQLREDVRNLSEIVDVIIFDFSVINTSLPSLVERIENASTSLNQTLELRASNQERLSQVEQNSTESIQDITALGGKSEDLVRKGEKLTDDTQELSLSVVLRFKRLNESYPRLQVLRTRIVEQEVKVVELQELADNLATRQTSLEALMDQTESHLETNVLNDELQAIDGTGKCLNYVGET